MPELEPLVEVLHGLLELLGIERTPLVRLKLRQFASEAEPPER